MARSSVKRQEGKQIALLARRVRKWLTLSVALGGISAVFLVFLFIEIARLVDDVAFHHTPLFAGHWVVLLSVCLILTVLTQFLSDIAGTQAGLHIVGSVRKDAMEHLEKAGPVVAARLPAGEVLTLLSDGVEALEPYFARYMPAAAKMVVQPLVILAVVAGLDGWSLLILLCTGPLIPVFMVLVGYRAQDLMDKQWVRMTILGGGFLDALRGLKTLRLFGRTADSLEQIAKMADEHRKMTLSVMKVAFLTSASLEFFASLSIALIAVVFGSRLLAGTVDFRTAFLVLMLAPEYFMPLRSFSANYHARQNAMAVTTRLLDIFSLPVSLYRNHMSIASENISQNISQNTPENITENILENIVGDMPENISSESDQISEQTSKHSAELLSDPLSKPHVEVATLTCEQISASYDGQIFVLEHVACRFERNKLTVLDGASGAGKSTLLAILLGFLPPSSGSISAWDREGKPIELGEVRMAWVPQRPLLVFGSVADNLRLGAESASLEALKHAAQQADALSFIESLPQGFDTSIGERGSKLSGGQIRRLALARAILHEPDVLILDEPTAGLDPTSTQRVSEAIKGCAKGRIVIAATHQSELLTRADVVYHIEEGRVTEISV
ncbi:MAG: thiol reductant ABC exporter subunit CydD [Acetobacter sp.]|nr:thiol reductant ABC exporter subunit CydD [Acetobacter sp.]MBO6086239.1 thiol reductant ABC exporter subunit CydD [Acetobacter sp.]MBO6091866.1 thiol reductant ABC exporter subunit CydD [Acetobacter sp.]